MKKPPRGTLCGGLGSHKVDDLVTPFFEALRGMGFCNLERKSRILHNVGVRFCNLEEKVWLLHNARAGFCNLEEKVRLLHNVQA